MQIGPLVIPPDRLAVGLAALVFLLAARLMARRSPGLAGWAVNALLAGVVAARVGFVARHARIYAEDPLSALAVWQGGFWPAAGAVGVLIVTLWHLRRVPDAIGPVVVVLVIGWIAHSVIAPFTRLGTAPPIPEISLAGLDGQGRRLAAGKPMVLNLWATWCPPCRREMPMMTELAAGSADIAFVFANQGESAGSVRRYLEAQGLPGADVFLDREQALMARYGAMGLPTTLFLAADGTLVAAHMGEISRAALIEGMERLRAQPLPPEAGSVRP
ncbi:prolipoprotein diacylglyceryl transferase family protein [Paenirhodobacter sp.]|uniref:prolipoprotein diacylglyceryl transferase family protein n=1 Tax=Paenirhodobacter sp. TaxID=1965326 RepID=UPI003B3D0DCC